jgi:hypothetical protein
MPAPSKLTTTRAANLLAGFLLWGSALMVWGGLAVVLAREFFLYMRG